MIGVSVLEKSSPQSIVYGPQNWTLWETT